VDVGELVTGLLHESDALEGREFDLVARPVIALVDPPKLERMVENLLVNASRHTPRGTRIWIKVLPQDGGALICVEDEGSGVPAELREAVFEPFRKGDPNTVGSGIGLSLVSRFAELLGGRAWVQDRPGGGASFRIFLPGPSRD
jgi:signal transduction histidine kinase